MKQLLSKSYTCRATLISACFAVIATSATPTLVFAASGHGGSHAHLPPFGEFLSGLWVYWFNFLLYCGLIFFLARKPVARIFAARRSAIEDRVMAGQRALAAAQRELEAAQQKISSLGDELARVRKEIQDETAAEVKALTADARTRATRIVKLAEESSAAERRSVESLVEQELIQSAYLLARERLVREASTDQDRGIREAVLRRVSQLVQ